MSSIQCYRSAISLYIAQGQQILAGSLAVEVADVVCCDLENFQQAVPFYRQAVELLGQNSSQLLCAMRKLASCYIKSSKRCNSFRFYYHTSHMHCSKNSDFCGHCLIRSH